MIADALAPVYQQLHDATQEIVVLKDQMHERVPYGDEVTLAAWGGLYLHAANGGPAQPGQMFTLIGSDDKGGAHESWTVTRGKSKG
jgi:hypothetical protein